MRLTCARATLGAASVAWWLAHGAWNIWGLVVAGVQLVCLCLASRETSTDDCSRLPTALRAAARRSTPMPEHSTVGRAQCTER